MSITSDTLTQGGQTQLHKLHMFSQVMGATLKVSLLIFAISFSVLFYINHCWQEVWFLMCYGKAALRMTTLNMLPKGFFCESYIFDKGNQIRTVSDYMLFHDETYVTFAHQLLHKFMILILYSLVMGIISFFILLFVWKRLGKKNKKVRILNGFECVAPKVLKKLIRKRGASSYHIGGIPFPKNTEYQHTMVTGTTGCGKSNMIHQLLEQIRKNGDQAIVVDTTGGIFSRFFDQEKDVLLNPLDKRALHWDIWQDIEKDSTIDEISEIIFSDSKAYDTFWIDGARLLFSETLRHLKKAKKHSFKELFHILFSMELSQVWKLLKHTPIASLLDPKIEKTALSVRAVLAKYAPIFRYLRDKDGGISLLNLIKEDHQKWIFLSCPTEERATLKPIFSVFLSLLIKGIMMRFENNHTRTWIIIDELASLNKLPCLLTGLAEMRKYGGCFVLGFQDLSQVEAIYGHHEAKTLSNLTNTKVLFRATDTEVALKVSRFLGEQEKEELSTSISYGANTMRDGVNLNQHKQTKQVVSASDVMMLKNLQAFVRFPENFPVSKISFEYTTYEEKNERCVPCQIEDLPMLKDPIDLEEEADKSLENHIITGKFCKKDPIELKTPKACENEGEIFYTF